MLTGAQIVVIFILVPQVRLKKRLDLDQDTASLPKTNLGAWNG